MSAPPDAITVRLPGWFGLADRLVGLLERLAPPPPGLAAAGPLLLVPKGSTLEWSMSSIPNDKDGIQHFVPADYDGPITGRIIGGDAASEVRAETPDGLAQRIVTVTGATGTVTVRYMADVRHGGDVQENVLDRTYEIVEPDAPGLQTTGVDIVDKG